MTSFYFKYNKDTYKAQARLTAANGKISCDIIDILSDYSGQRLDFDQLETGILHPSSNPLMNAINKGFENYINNFPVTRH